MANTSIYAAFERMWQHVVAKLGNKSDINHDHGDLYYTQTQIDNKLQFKSDSTHNHDSVYDVKGAAEESLTSAKSYTDTKTANLISASDIDAFIPVRGVDYWTEDDIAEIKSYVDDAILGGAW